MIKTCLMFVLLIGTIVGCSAKEVNCSIAYTPDEDVLSIKNTSSPYIGKLSISDTMSIRVLILKHCPDSIADVDAGQAISAVNLAASKGLTIKDIGNYRIDKKGKTDRVVFDKLHSGNDLEGLKKFIMDQMKIDAKPNDTLVIYTIGHGGGGGELMRLGLRAPFMKILAEAAEENDQQTLWWQLSCHAAAKLPEISTLNEKQQYLFSMVASSPANELSYFNTQGAQLSKLFSAMAVKSKDIDPDQNNTITAKELSDFLTKEYGQKRGKLVFAKNPEKPIFGVISEANRIPIIDKSGPQKEYPKNHIPNP